MSHTELERFLANVDTNDPRDLAAEFKRLFLEEGKTTELSVYGTVRPNWLDDGHALGLVASGMGANKWQKSYDKWKTAKIDKRGTFILRSQHLPPGTTLRFSPENNTDLYPANRYHYDLHVIDHDRLAMFFVEGIRNKEIACYVFDNEALRPIAAAVYTYCLRTYGGHRELNITTWQDGLRLSAERQGQILSALAGFNTFNHRP